MPERHHVALPSVDAVDTLPPEHLPAFVAQLSALALRAAARLAPVAAGEHSAEHDRMLDIAEVSARTGMSRDWLYRNKKSLPFMRRIGRKVVFSEAGLERWLARR